MNLPVELLDLIIQDFAKNEDLDSIRACCLISRHLVHICRRHLFSYIELIVSPERADIMKKFGQILEQNRSLSLYVRKINIQLHMAYASKEGLSFLLHLNMVEGFIIRLFNFPGGNASQRKWSSLSQGFFDSLLPFIERNPITELSLFAIEELPSSTFRLFRNLQKVVLLNVTPPTVIGTDGPIVPIPLKSLDLRKGSIPLDQIFTLSLLSFDLTGLKQLLVGVRFKGKDLDTLRRLLSMCDCLEVLTIDVDDSPYLRNIACHISPNSLKTLRNLHITLHICEGQNSPPYGHLNDELSVISGSNVLEKLEFEVVSEITAQLDLTYAAWEGLDEVLSVDGGFPFLKNVKVDVVFCHCGVAEELGPIKQGIDDVLEHSFQRLKRNLTFVSSAEVVHI